MIKSCSIIIKQCFGDEQGEKSLIKSKRVEDSPHKESIKLLNKCIEILLKFVDVESLY